MARWIELVKREIVWKHTYGLETPTDRPGSAQFVRECSQIHLLLQTTQETWCHNFPVNEATDACFYKASEKAESDTNKMFISLSIHPPIKHYIVVLLRGEHFGYIVFMADLHREIFAVTGLGRRSERRGDDRAQFTADKGPAVTYRAVLWRSYCRRWDSWEPRYSSYTSSLRSGWEGRGDGKGSMGEGPIWWNSLHQDEIQHSLDVWDYGIV